MLKHAHIFSDFNKHLNVIGIIQAKKDHDTYAN